MNSENHSRTLKFIHFNDVYELKEDNSEPIGGSARFKTAIDLYRDSDSIVCFSGDLFYPSLFSNVTQGEHMVFPMNEFGTRVACFGNHDFDIDLNLLEKRVEQCNFPWLLSNVRDKKTKMTLGGGQEYYVLDHNGLKIGFVGLAEYDWLQILPLDCDDIEYEDFVKCSERLYGSLKNELGCDLVIALTHMRNYNDENLAKNFDKFDLILGGHDHVDCCKNVNGTFYVKSGNLLSNEQKEKLYKGKFSFDRKLIEVSSHFNPDRQQLEHIEKYDTIFHQLMQKTLGFTEVELDTSFKAIRTQEQSFSNFIADIIRLTSGADCCIINTGTIRSNSKFPQGKLTYSHLSKALPYTDPIINIEVSGRVLLRALENGVSKYPHYEGRFPAVSGLVFSFDPEKEAMSRIRAEDVFVNGEQLDLEKLYVVATKYYVATGKDGYSMFSEAKIMTEIVNADEITGMVRKFFEMAREEEFEEIWAKINTKNELKEPTTQIRKDFASTHLKTGARILRLKSLINGLVYENGEKFVSIRPQIENRISCMKNSKRIF